MFSPPVRVPLSYYMCMRAHVLHSEVCGSAACGCFRTASQDGWQRERHGNTRVTGRAHFRDARITRRGAHDSPGT